MRRLLRDGLGSFNIDHRVKDLLRLIWLDIGASQSVRHFLVPCASDVDAGIVKVSLQFYWYHSVIHRNTERLTGREGETEKSIRNTFKRLHAVLVERPLEETNDHHGGGCGPSFTARHGELLGLIQSLTSSVLPSLSSHSHWQKSFQPLFVRSHPPYSLCVLLDTKTLWSQGQALCSQTR